MYWLGLLVFVYVLGVVVLLVTMLWKFMTSDPGLRFNVELSMGRKILAMVRASLFWPIAIISGNLKIHF